MARNCDHAHCTLCGKCLTCEPHPPHTGRYGNPRGTGARSNGNSFGPDTRLMDWQERALRESQPTFWDLI